MYLIACLTVLSRLVEKWLGQFNAELEIIENMLFISPISLKLPVYGKIDKALSTGRKRIVFKFTLRFDKKW